MHEKLLKVFIYTSGFVCLIVFLSVRIVPEKSMNMLLKVKTYEEYEDSTKYGELFYISKVNLFKEDLPQAMRKYRFSEKHPRLNDSDIIIFGDSHFDHSRFVSFPELLSDKTGKKVFYYRINRPFWGNALAYLETMGYQPGPRRLFIYGSTERYIPERFMMKYEPQVMRNKESIHRHVLNNILFLNNTDLLYSTILKRSYLTYHANLALLTLRFHLFDYISSVTPVYHIDRQNGSWLFIREGIDHTTEEFPQQEVEIIASNIQHMASEMDRRYNLDFIFIPIPERSAIYTDLVGQGEYNKFLERLYGELEKRGVAYIPLYEDFRNSNQYVFHKTDTHWNKNGVSIGLEKTIEKINGNGSTQMATFPLTENKQ